MSRVSTVRDILLIRGKWSDFTRGVYFFTLGHFSSAKSPPSELRSEIHNENNFVLIDIVCCTMFALAHSRATRQGVFETSSCIPSTK